MRHRALSAVLIAAALASPLAAQDGEITFQATEVAPGIYMLEGVGGFAGGNLGLLVGDDDGPVLIDDGLPPLTDEILEAIGKLTDEPIEFLVNTHVHGDHIGGNEALAERDANIVAHEKLRERLLADGLMTASGPEPAPAGALPVVTFSDSITFHVNGHEAHVFHVAAAHTDGDAVIHFRTANVIHTGDVMFNGLFPFIDLDSGGSVDGYLEAQRRILALADDETRIIPGHGPVATRADLQAATDMLATSYSRVRSLVEAGKSADEIVAANPLADYDDDWSWGFITTERMTRTLVRALANDG